MESSSHHKNGILHKKSLNAKALLRKKSLMLTNKQNLLELVNQHKKKNIFRSKTIKFGEDLSDIHHENKETGVSPTVDHSPHIHLNKLQSLRHIEKSEENRKKDAIHVNNEENTYKTSRKIVKLKPVFDSKDDEETEDSEEDKRDEDTFIIPLESYFKLIWDIYMFILILLTTSITPIKICFELSNLSIIEAYFEICFIFDIFLTFFTQIQDFNENLINSKKRIAYEYLLNWLLIDIVSSIPFNTIDLIFSFDNFWLNFFKWSAILRFNKLQKYHYLKDIKIFNETKVGRLIELILYFLIMINISSCFWIYIGKISGNVNNWIHVADLDESSNYDVYVASIYFNIVTIYSVGYGDILCRNNYERYYNIFLLFFGVMLYSFGLTSLSKIFVEENQRRTTYLNKVSYLKEISNMFDVNDELYNSIKASLWIEYEKNYADRFEFLDNLPTKIKHELSGYIYNVLIKELIFFQNQPYDFLLFVMPYLKSHQLEHGQILLSDGEVLDEMYLVVSGILSLHLGQIYDNMEIYLIRENDHFGDVFLQTNEESPFELKCKSKISQVFVLRKADFEKIKINYNKNILNILEGSLRILENIRKRKDQIVKLLSHEKSIFNVKNLICRLDQYLFKIGFDDYFFKGRPFEDMNEFLATREPYKIKEIIRKIDKKKKISRSNNFNKLGDKLRRSFIESKFKKLECIRESPIKFESIIEDKERIIEENKSPEEGSPQNWGNRLLEFKLELRKLDEMMLIKKKIKKEKRKKKKKYMEKFNKKFDLLLNKVYMQEDIEIELIKRENHITEKIIVALKEPSEVVELMKSTNIKPSNASRRDTKKSITKLIINNSSFDKISIENVEEFTIGNDKKEVKELSILQEQSFSISSTVKRGDSISSEENKANQKTSKETQSKGEHKKKNKVQEGGGLEGFVNYNINNSQYTLNFFMDKEGKFPNDFIKFKGSMDRKDGISDQILSMLDNLNPGRDESECFNHLKRINNIYDQILLNSIRIKTETGKEQEE